MLAEKNDMHYMDFMIPILLKKTHYITLDLDMFESSLGLSVDGNLEFVPAARGNVDMDTVHCRILRLNL